MDLIITEKPDAFRKYINYFETRHNMSFSKTKVSAQSDSTILVFTRGHVAELAEPHDYNPEYEKWNITHLPIIPTKWKYRFSKDTNDRVNAIVKAIKNPNVKRIINACDPGREGEIIFELIFKIVNSTSPRYRIIAKDFDHDTLTEALNDVENNPISSRQNLINTALLRQMSDWLIGLNMTRKYALQYNSRNISVGRVQTPVLSLINDRYQEITNWQPKSTYQILASYTDGDFLYLNSDNKTKFDDLPTLHVLLKKLSASPTATVVSSNQKQKVNNPPKPADLAEVQKMGNARFNYTATEVLSFTQSLYEKQLISYPRTDSQYLTETLFSENYDLANLLLTNVNQQSIIRAKDSDFNFINDNKVVDHYALVPLKKISDPNHIQNLTEDESNILAIVIERFLQAFSKPHIQSELTILLSLSSNERMIHRSNQTIDPGYKGYFKKAEDENDSVSNKPSSDLLKMSKEHIISLQDFKINEVPKTKPSFYTEGTLLTAMQTAGRTLTNPDHREIMKEHMLGTPATQASIFELFKQRNYITVEKKKFLIPTEKAINLLTVCTPQLKSAVLTGKWEYQLNQVAQGKLSYDEYYKDLIVFVEELVKADDKVDNISIRDVNAADKIACPICKVQSLEQNKFGVFCQSSDCKFALHKKQYNKNLTSEQQIELIKNKKTKKLQGFVSQQKNKYSAKLILNIDGEVKISLD